MSRTGHHDAPSYARLSEREALAAKQDVEWRQIVKDIHAKDTVRRRRAIEAVSRVADRELLPDLRVLVGHRHWEVRLAATEAVGNVLVSTNAPTSELLERLADSVNVVRIQAIQALEGIGGTKALRALRSCLTDRHPLVRSYAAAAIGSLGTTGDLRRLELVLRNEKSAAARIGLYDGIFVLGGSWALDGLIGLLHDPDYRVRCSTSESLVRTAARHDNASRIYRALRTTLSVEPTVAAREVLTDGVKTLQSRFKLVRAQE